MADSQKKKKTLEIFLKELLENLEFIEFRMRKNATGIPESTSEGILVGISDEIFEKTPRELFG